MRRRREIQAPKVQTLRHSHVLRGGWEKAQGRGTSKEAEVVRVVAGSLA